MSTDIISQPQNYAKVVCYGKQYFKFLVWILTQLVLYNTPLSLTPHRVCKPQLPCTHHARIIASTQQGNFAVAKCLDGWGPYAS